MSNTVVVLVPVARANAESRGGTERVNERGDEMVPWTTGRHFIPSLLRLAEPTGFEPAISCLTGRYARPLHHASAL